MLLNTEKSGEQDKESSKERLVNTDPDLYLHWPQQALAFTCLQHKYFENTVGKGEIARSSVFYPFGEL